MEVRTVRSYALLEMSSRESKPRKARSRAPLGKAEERSAPAVRIEGFEPSLGRS